MNHSNAKKVIERVGIIMDGKIKRSGAAEHEIKTLQTLASNMKMR